MGPSHTDLQYNDNFQPTFLRLAHMRTMSGLPLSEHFQFECFQLNREISIWKYFSPIITIPQVDMCAELVELINIFFFVINSVSK